MVVASKSPVEDIAQEHHEQIIESLLQDAEFVSVTVKTIDDHVRDAPVVDDGERLAPDVSGVAFLDNNDRYHALRLSRLKEVIRGILSETDLDLIDSDEDFAVEQVAEMILVEHFAAIDLHFADVLDDMLSGLSIAPMDLVSDRALDQRDIAGDLGVRS